MGEPSHMILGISELIQSGILFTLLGIAFGLGKVYQKIDQKIVDHDRRIGKLEDRIY
jgi:hypothetical protein